MDALLAYPGEKERNGEVPVEHARPLELGRQRPVQLRWAVALRGCGRDVPPSLAARRITSGRRGRPRIKDADGLVAQRRPATRRWIAARRTRESASTSMRTANCQQ